MWSFKRRQPDRKHLVRQGNEALRKQDYATAIAVYKSLLAETPDDIGLLMNLGAAYHLSGQHTPAIERFERVLELDPGNATALINLAAAHGTLGHHDRGIEALVKALELDPTKRDLHYNLAVLYLRKGLLPNAMAELELELAIHPEHALARSTLTDLRRQYLGRA